MFQYLPNKPRLTENAIASISSKHIVHLSKKTPNNRKLIGDKYIPNRKKFCDRFCTINEGVGKCLNQSCLHNPNFYLFFL